MLIEQHGHHHVFAKEQLKISPNTTIIRTYWGFCMLSKRRWVGVVLAVLAVRLGAADVEVKSPAPSPLADAVQHGDVRGVP